MGPQLYQSSQPKAGEPVNASPDREETMRNPHRFAVWAGVYDKQDNPLLSLEERYLARLLPDYKGKDVLDVGCGTGRWLRRLALGGPASLHGLDSSREMLRVAAGKHLANTQLTHAELPSLPATSASADLVLASFVLSYVDDLAQCALELARVTRAGGDLFISDMHPETAAALGWKRGFGAAGQAYMLQAEQRPIGAVVDTFASNGFALAASLEPPFGETEHALFRAKGRDTAWQQATGSPAIYLLHLRRTLHPRSLASPVNALDNLHLHGAHCALGPDEVLPASIATENGVIASIVTRTAPAGNRSVPSHDVDLHGYLLFPGLVNAHDHLEFALFPRLGRPLYKNAVDWALDIQANENETIALHKQVPKDVRLWWGGIRNLLCGATTVCHHNQFDPLLQNQDFPVRVVANYGWAHSVAFATDIASALKRTALDEPFFIHACEGVDQTSADELEVLDAIGAIEERSVLVHGLALDDTGAMLLNQRRASLIICPSSNHYLFGKTLTSGQLRSIERLAIGSDSPLTANGDLLDELRFARFACNLSAEELYGLVTDRAVRVVRLSRGEGTLRATALADLIAIRHRIGTSSTILTESSWRDVELVLIGGIVQLASSQIFDRLPTKLKKGLSPLVVEGELRWLRAPVSNLLDSAESVLGRGNVRIGGLRVSGVEA
jgi:ubiquinone/menaquinone biosynthesis C-methylase UbiE